jgi:hypothetical protein
MEENKKQRHFAVAFLVVMMIASVLAVMPVAQANGLGNCCACPAESNTGDPCVCMQATNQNNCVSDLNGTWVGPNACTLGTTTGCEGLYCQAGACIPEFSTIAIPVASILGLLFFFNYRKRKREQ